MRFRRLGALAAVLGVAAAGVAVGLVWTGSALTAIGRLPGAALATLLGTVVAYFFVQHRAEGPSSNGQAAPGGSPQSGGGSGEDGG
jgi:hypothetical protein